MIAYFFNDRNDTSNLKILGDRNMKTYCSWCQIAFILIEFQCDIRAFLNILYVLFYNALYLLDTYRCFIYIHRRKMVQ